MTKAFSSTEIQLHVATQMLSLTGINFVGKEDDDSHTTSRFDAQAARIVGRTFNLGGARYRAFIDVRGFALGLEKDGSDLHVLPLDGLSYDETVAPWKQWLVEAGHSGDLVLDLHYEMPESESYQFKHFAKPAAAILDEWITLRSLANDALSTLTTELGIASEVNIWPHHFDTGTYYVVHKTDGDVDRSIGAGLAVADSMVPEPYFYIYGWDKDAVIDYSEAPDLGAGKWITGGWEGAVLPSSSSEGSDAFYKLAVGFLKKELS